ncbi:hypothetical protein ACIQK5_37485 [Streptomyces virginiae]|uniref:hypothetical protein n=1 Tax=Streptomyces virginiae TaxID=1961 RepID=UPI0037F699F6
MDTYDRDHCVPGRTCLDLDHQALARTPVWLSVRRTGFGGLAFCPKEEGDLRGERWSQLLRTCDASVRKPDDEVAGAGRGFR